MADKDNEKIYVMDFIRKYNDLNSEKAKEAYFSSILKENVYVPYINKMAVIDTLLQSAHTVGNKVIYNTPKEFQMYTFTLILTYTNLDFGKDANTNKIFDELNKYGLMDKLINAIGEKNEVDVNEFASLFKMAKDDFMMNFAKTNLDNEAIVNAVGAGIMQGMMSIMDSIKTAFEDPETQKILNEYLSQQRMDTASNEAVNKILSMN